jgi:hypothetical protein
VVLTLWRNVTNAYRNNWSKEKEELEYSYLWKDVATQMVAFHPKFLHIVSTFVVVIMQKGWTLLTLVEVVTKLRPSENETGDIGDSNHSDTSLITIRK